MPDGSRVATGSLLEEAVKLFEWATGMEFLTLSTEGSGVSEGIRFSADGTSLGVRTGEPLFIWRAPTFAEIGMAEVLAAPAAPKLDSPGTPALPHASPQPDPVH